jgi:hypothetical protein
MGELIAIAVVCSVLGYLWGYLKGVGETPLPDGEPVKVMDSRENPELQLPAGFTEFQLYIFRRGTFELMFKLDTGDLAPAEQSIVAHTVSINPGGLVTLELRCNVDESDDVPC